MLNSLKFPSRHVPKYIQYICPAARSTSYHPVTVATGRPTSRIQFWTVKQSQRSRWNRGFDRTASISAETAARLQNTETRNGRDLTEAASESLKQKLIMQPPTAFWIHLALKESLNPVMHDGICQRSAAQKKNKMQLK